MTNFFKNFPYANYKFGNESTSALFQNISAYVDVFNEITDRETIYEDYEVLDIDRPDILSDKLYGTPEYYWTFYLTNPELAIKGWPVSESEMYENKEEFFTGHALAIKYDKDTILDSAPWRWANGDLLDTNSTFIDGFNDYVTDNDSAPDPIFNFIRPGTILSTQRSKGSGTQTWKISSGTELWGNCNSYPWTSDGFQTQYSYGVVTKVDYNLGVVYFKGWRGIGYIEVTDPGTGYDVPPKVIIEGSGKGAYAEAVVDSSGGVTEVKIYKPGYDYTPYAWSGKWDIWKWHKPQSLWDAGYYETRQTSVLQGTPTPYAGLNFQTNGLGDLIPTNLNFVDDEYKSHGGTNSLAGFDAIFKSRSVGDANIFAYNDERFTTKIRFERQSSQQGRDAQAYAQVNDERVFNNLESNNESKSFLSIIAFNLPEDYRDWDWRKYPDYKDSSLNYNLFAYYDSSDQPTSYGFNGQWKGYATSYTTFSRSLYLNITDDEGALHYYGPSKDPEDLYAIGSLSGVFLGRDNVIQGANGTISVSTDRYDDADSDFLYNAESRTHKFIPEKFIDYTLPDLSYTDSNYYYGRYYEKAGGAIGQWGSAADSAGGFSRAIYNATQGYYEIPVYDPRTLYRTQGEDAYFNDPFAPLPGGTVRLLVDSNGETGTIVGLTGDSGDTYQIDFEYGSGPMRGRRWDKPSVAVANPADVIHHWEDGFDNRIDLNVFDDSAPTFRWYDFYDEAYPEGSPYALPFENVFSATTAAAQGNYVISDNPNAIKVTNFENLLKQTETTRRIKVLKPDVVQKIAEAFYKAIGESQ